MDSDFRHNFWRILWVTLAVLGVSLLFFFALKSPKEKAQARELEYMKQQYEILDQRLDSLEILLVDLEKRDNGLYRTIFELEPIPRQVLHSSDTSLDIVAEVTKKMDSVENRVDSQSMSYDELFELARKRSDLLAHIPSIFPLKASDLNYISSYFGYRSDPIYKVSKFHSGIDFTSTLNAEALATGDGVVDDVTSDRWGYGNMVVLDHGYGYKTRYAHLNKFAVEKGQKVKRGQVVGYIGCTGKATGVHLHYEVLKDDKLVDPKDYLFQDLSSGQYEQILEQSTLPIKTTD